MTQYYYHSEFLRTTYYHLHSDTQHTLHTSHQIKPRPAYQVIRGKENKTARKIFSRFLPKTVSFVVVVVGGGGLLDCRTVGCLMCALPLRRRCAVIISFADHPLLSVFWASPVVPHTAGCAYPAGKSQSIRSWDIGKILKSLLSVVCISQTRSMVFFPFYFLLYTAPTRSGRHFYIRVSLKKESHHAR